MNSFLYMAGSIIAFEVLITKLVSYFSKFLFIAYRYEPYDQYYDISS